MNTRTEIPNPKINWHLYRSLIAARNAKICLMRDDGKRLQEIGNEFNLSRQRVWQILQRHQPQSETE